MLIIFRSILAAAMSLALVPTADNLAKAQNVYPTKQVTIITPGAPGSTADLMPRLIGEELSSRLGKPVIVENRMGGSGLISGSSALALPGDGHTLWFGTMGTLTINPFVLDSMPFDPLTAWTPIALVASMPLVLVINPEKAASKSLADFIQLAKEQPKKVTFGSAGAGSSYAITMFLLGKQAGVQFTHIPYRGTVQAVAGVLGGEITAMVPDAALVKAQIDSGKLRALAVTMPSRIALLPDVPTFKELGYDINVSLWYGIFVRSNTPESIVSRLVNELRVVMKSPKIQQRWDSLSLVVGDKFGDDFATYYRSEYQRWGGILRPLGIKQSAQ